MSAHNEIYNQLYYLFRDLPDEAQPSRSKMHYFAGQLARIIERAIEDGVRAEVRRVERRN